MSNVAETRPSLLNPKRANFVRLAEKRTANAIRTIRFIGRLANRRSYEYSDVDTRKIVAALEAEVEAVKALLTAPGNKPTQAEFTL